MHTKKTKDKGEKKKSNVFNSATTGNGISEMMTKCCAGGGGFPDCATVMKSMMEEMKKQHCTPDKDAAESERRKK